jgi:hypothetical protein
MTEERKHAILFAATLQLRPGKEKAKAVRYKAGVVEFEK